MLGDMWDKGPRTDFNTWPFVPVSLHLWFFLHQLSSVNGFLDSINDHLRLKDEELAISQSASRLEGYGVPEGVTDEIEKVRKQAWCPPEAGEDNGIYELPTWSRGMPSDWFTSISRTVCSRTLPFWSDEPHQRCWHQGYTQTAVGGDPQDQSKKGKQGWLFSNEALTRWQARTLSDELN